MAEPAGTLMFTGPRAARPSRGGWQWLGPSDARPSLARAGPDDPVATLEAVTRATARPASPNDADPDRPPFDGGWIGSIAYDAGALIEPAATSPSPATDDHPWPVMFWHRCPAAYVYDGLLARWWIVGREDAASCLPPLSSSHRGDLRSGARPEENRPRYRLGEMTSLPGRDGYERSVALALDYIRAGDIYQVNLAHRLCGTFSGSGRAFFADLMRRSRAWYGAYLEAPAGDALDSYRRLIASASPELFLRLDGATGRVLTRPMKGTRPLTADPRELRDHHKDRAELNMIVDLMRNDLGRVCRFGSVRVDEPRAIERHGAPLGGEGGGGDGGEAGVYQGVATVSGDLRPGVGLADLLRATFPGGSVTGAPKIRAMQIIDELERPSPLPPSLSASSPTRGPYCGAIGSLSDCGTIALSIAIRTALITGQAGSAEKFDEVADGTLSYPVGAGIVADSLPEAEWRETMDKAGVLLAMARDRERAV